MDSIKIRMRALFAPAWPVLLVLAAAACGKSDKASTTKTTAATEPVATEEESAPEPEDDKLLEAVVTWKDVGLSSPESVLHDENADVYLVSNIDGAPLARDNKAFISKLTPDGKVEAARFIEARKNKVTLNAPKGMAIRNDELYVADIDVVRVFDRKTGAPRGEVKIPGATFLNDVELAPDGRILVSDVGLKANRGALDPSGTDAVWVIDMKKKAKPLAKRRLGGPKGIVPTSTKVWVTSLGSGELFSIDPKGNVGDIQKLPAGALASIVAVGNDFIVPSWEANAIFRGPPGGDFRVIIAGVQSPSDLAYDRKRGRLLVPMLMDNEVRAYDVK